MEVLTVNCQKFFSLYFPYVTSIVQFVTEIPKKLKRPGKNYVCLIAYSQEQCFILKFCFLDEKSVTQYPKHQFAFKLIFMEVDLRGLSYRPLACFIYNMPRSPAGNRQQYHSIRPSVKQLAGERWQEGLCLSRVVV